MSAARLLSAVAGRAARRPGLVVAIALALGLGGAALALRLRPTAATSTFVSGSSPQYRATQRYYASFGEEPVEVLVKGDLQQLLLSSDIDRLVGLEGCLSGNVPPSGLAAAGGPHGPCGQLARAKTVKVVFGPGTFVNEAANQIDHQLAVQTAQAEAQARQAQLVVTRAGLAQGLEPSQARALGSQASKVTLARFQESLVRLALQYGLTKPPSLNDPAFVSTLVFDSTKRAGTPKERFAYLFPSRDAALISVRMKPGLSEQAKTHTIGLIRAAVAMEQWRPLHGASYLVTGEPVIVSDLKSSIANSIELLGVIVALVMAGALGLIFYGRPRLLPLALALLAVALTFGALSLVGASLTVASVAALPVLVGLAVDYAIQFQSRVEEAFAQDQQARSGLAGSAQGRCRLVQSAAAVGAPPIATACAASAAAMVTLVLSPVPMVRGFGLLLFVGVGVALACTLTVGAAAMVLARRPGAAAPLVAGVTGDLTAPRRPGPGTSLRKAAAQVGARTRTRVGVHLGAAWRGAREVLYDNPVNRLIWKAALVVAVRRPGRVLGVGLALAALGWGLDGQTRVETDITKLVPQNLSSLSNLQALERASGVGGEIDLTVSGADLATPSTIAWMTSYQRTVLKRFGYTSARGCGQARLCPAFSLPDLFQGQAGAGQRTGKLTQARVSGLLDAIPPYFSQAVIAPDKRTGTLAFGIRLMGLSEQQQLIEAMRASLHPPAGVTAQLVGLPVLAAQSGTQVASAWRRIEILIAGLAAVALVLLVAFRGDLRRVFVPLAPIALATGWSALILFAVRIPLNPMSVTLGALVVAVSTEFSVLLSERHRQERLAGHHTVDALRRTYRHTGAAVAASGVTAIAGFGVLAFSDIRMLRDFGLVTLIDLTVSLVGVLVALPAALVIGEGPEPATLRGGLGRARASLTEAIGGYATGLRSVAGRLRRRSRAGHEPV